MRTARAWTPMMQKRKSGSSLGNVASLDAGGRWLKTEFGPRGHALAQCESSLGDAVATCPAGSSSYVRSLKTDERGNVVLECRGDLAAREVKRTYSADRGRLGQLCAGNVATCDLQN